MKSDIPMVNQNKRRREFLKIMSRCDCGVKEGEIHKRGCKSISKGEERIPYIVTPLFCRRCLKPYPDLFIVPNKEWKKYVPKNLRNEFLCKSCYNKIKKWMKKGIGKRRIIHK